MAPATRLATVLGRVLQAGVLASAAVALFGGLIFLRRHGAALPEYAAFHGVPAFAFARERDWVYVAICSIVLAMLTFGFFGGISLP